MLFSILGSPIVSAEWTSHRKKNLLKYIALTYRNTHTMYAFRYIFCEFLNFLNVVSSFLNSFQFNFLWFLWGIFVVILHLYHSPTL